ncbi:hypothetical protein C1H46_018901 [Malus baccata]|uniref:Defective in cullin neddylation protein n=1 Tax=Malus baccata TaxID=106549 RepID=A0A540MAI7_MALBA|nr:hypothetical protein C1H46_018901 [Malus baccata]
MLTSAMAFQWLEHTEDLSNREARFRSLFSIFYTPIYGLQMGREPPRVLKLSISWFMLHAPQDLSIKAANKELERIDAVFISYENASSGLIDPEGIERLCSDLEVDHTDVRVLMLAWKMKAEKQGYFTLEEWRVGLKGLRVDNVNKLKKALPELEKEVRRPSNFVDFYSYAFEYCLTEEKQKSIDIDSICELLNIVLGSQYHLQVDLFTQYLKIQNDYKVINMDQWMGFYRFCNEISFPDLSNYDPELAWPLILDNFVDWIQDKQSQS